MNITRRIIRRIHRAFFPTNKIILHRIEPHIWYDTDTRMFESMFELLCEYVENELSTTSAHDETTWWEKFKLKWVPRTLRYELSRQLAMKHLAWETQLDDGKSDQAIKAQTVKELYEWYRDVYPFIKDPYETTQDPEHMFLDANGNPTNEAFVKDENGVYYTMNRFHPEYSNLLKEMNTQEELLNEMIDAKLHTLLSIRRYLWT